MAKRYDNGELVTKERIEDEEWYGIYYQPFLEFSLQFSPYITKETYVDPNDIYHNAIQKFGEFFNEELEPLMKQKILTWSVLIAERYNSVTEEDIEQVNK
jgi:hypothetical protein